MNAPLSTPDADDRANLLYWGSAKSVNQIAEELDLSKGALYGLIRPLPAASCCPLCGEEAVHSNRTAKERGRIDCPSCGWDGTAEEALPYDPSSLHVPAAVPPAPRDRSLEGRARRTLAGGALLGAAVGLALVLWARRQ